MEFLKANPFLVVDTRFFGQDFKDRLLASFENLEHEIGGLLVHGENLQTLNLLKARYEEQIRCIYIDPPYNTGGEGFVYKDNYQRSSWLSLMFDRLELSRGLLAEGGLIFTSIDDAEVTSLKSLLTEVYGADNFVSQPVWKNKYGAGAKTIGYISLHEYVLCFAKDARKLASLNVPLGEEGIKAYKYRDEKYDTRGPHFTQPCMTSSLDARPNLVYPLIVDGEEIWPDKQWVWGRARLEKALRDNNLVIKKKSDGKYSVRFKQYLRDENGRLRRAKPLSILEGPYTQEGTSVLNNLFKESPYNFPKPVGLIEKIVDVEVKEEVQNGQSGLILDFFAGSGTTAHAVITLNRKDDGNRKYILVEMGNYFDTALRPRIQKVIYSKDWKDGKPVSRQGSSHMFKYIRLESYEDTLNNLELKRTDAQRSLLEQADSFRETYILSYMLNVESKGSASLLNIDQFEDPFNYKLRIATGSAGETKPVTVDLVETFNRA